MRVTRFITLAALFTAVLISVQFALSGVGGVELVTVIFLSVCYYTGVKTGVTVSICFSVMRCFIFGFFPTVIILYLIYYTGFALFFGFLGNKFRRTLSPAKFVAIVVFAAAFTALFSLLDDVITPLFYGFGRDAAVSYFYASLPFMAVQVLCAAVSVSLLIIPLGKVFSALTKN